jgi:hypothetical protein
MVGHSTGGGEAVRYLCCHGAKRVAKARRRQDPLRLLAFLSKSAAAAKRAS